MTDPLSGHRTAAAIVQRNMYAAPEPTAIRFLEETTKIARTSIGYEETVSRPDPAPRPATSQYASPAAAPDTANARSA